MEEVGLVPKEEFMKKLTFAFACLSLALPLAAQTHDHQMAQTAPAAAPRTEKTDFLFVWDDAAKKLTDLAAAIPAEKYAWRPAEGVRSVGEAVAHVASGVYYLTLSMGVKPPAGYPSSFAEAEALEKMPGKAEATAALAKALAYARQAAEAATPELLAKEVDFFGQKVNGRTLFLLLEGHCQEHLGQLIAYARMNGVVPPWSRSGN
jgi:uncharacterized damage-inducible protein DinB